MTEAKASANSNDFATVYRITKELLGGYKPVVDPVMDVNGKFVINDDGQLKK